MANIYLLKFNNYYNRIVKRFDTISEYSSYLTTDEPFTSVNFNPNDGIDTEDIKNITEIPDYYIVADKDGNISSRWFVIECKRLRSGQYKLSLHRDLFADFYDNILNCPLFVEKATLPATSPLIFNSEQMTYNQIKKSEDLLKDETNCPWIVGYVASNEAFSNPISASVSVDVSETVAGISNYSYYNKSYKEFNSVLMKMYYFYITGILMYDNMVMNSYITPKQNSYSITKKPVGSSSSSKGLRCETLPIGFYDSTYNLILQEYKNLIISNLVSNASISNYNPSAITSMLKENGKVIKDSSTSKYYRVNIVKNTSSVNTLAVSLTAFNNQWEPLKSFYDRIKSYFKDDLGGTINNAFEFDYVYNTYSVDLVEIVQPTATRTLTLSATRNHLIDAPYDMFCIPFSDDLKVYDNGSLVITATSKRDALGIVSQLMKDYQISVYDVQLLPYCPVRNAIKRNGNFDVVDNSAFYILDSNNNKTNVVIFADSSEFTFNINYSRNITRPGHEETVNVAHTKNVSSLDFGQAIALTGDGNYVYFDFDLADIGLADATITAIREMEIWNFPSGYNIDLSQVEFLIFNDTSIGFKIPSDYQGTVASITFSMELRYTVSENVFKNENPLAIDMKIENETSFCRLCSPNYASSFDFSLAKNDGIDYINVDCNYKPFMPYIHLNPNFKYLYGQDFDDPRGLICGGDFSLTSTEDKWRTYQLQNKNYQLAFDRQIESVDLRNSIAKKQDIFNAISGTLTGAAAGAIGGGLSPLGAAGAIAGGTLGGTASAIGGIMDVAYNEQLRTDARDLTIDQFNYALGNIQALPYTLNKVAAFNKNNKIFPILEYYSCTDEEKEALKNKLKYNGMTVMVLGKIKDYLLGHELQYIKGQVIRIEDLADDFHTANAIADELYKGGYF